MGAQQCHMKPKVSNGAAGLLLTTHLVFFLCHVLISSDLQISVNEVFYGFEKAYHMVKKHATWPKGTPHSKVVCPYIPHDIY